MRISDWSSDVCSSDLRPAARSTPRGDRSPAGGGVTADAAPMLRELVEQRRILVCCGSGGVGKTTTAAVLAMEAARAGRRAVVVTIEIGRESGRARVCQCG